jgi:hypothetical protein
MAPEYDLFHENLLKSRDDVIVARLEGSINEDISMIYEIFSFPKIVLFEPNSPDIKANFSGKRVADVMEKWIEKVAPKIEKKNPTQEVNKEDKLNKKEENLDKKIEENKNNKEKTTEEVEFIRRELDNMKNRFLNMEEELKNLKNYFQKINKDLEEAKSGNLNKEKNETGKEKEKEKINNNIDNKNHEGLTEEMKLKLNAFNEKKKKILENYSIADFILYFCIFLFFIGAIITIRKIFFINNKIIVSAADHPKV